MRRVPLLLMALSLLCGIAISGCSSFTFLVANAPATLGHYSRLDNIVYMRPNSNKQANTLDVYRPVIVADHSVPVVIFVHGGGWDSGDKNNYKFVGAALAEQGYVAVLPNYSLYPKVKSPVFCQDIADAVAYVHAHANEWGGNANEIYLMGHSAGAHIVMMVTLDQQFLHQAGGDTSWLHGVIGLAGPYDFLPFTYPYMNDLFGPPEKYSESQPVNFVRADAPPLLLMHGLQDHTVAPTNTRSLYDAMSKAGGRVQVEYFENATHSDLIAAFSFLRNRKPPVMAKIRQFIDRNDAVSTTAIVH